MSIRSEGRQSRQRDRTRPLRSFVALGIADPVPVPTVFAKTRDRMQMACYPVVGDVRARGLLTAMDFVAVRESLAPLPGHLNAVSRFVEMACARGSSSIPGAAGAATRAITCPSRRRSS